MDYESASKLVDDLFYAAGLSGKAAAVLTETEDGRWELSDGQHWELAETREEGLRRQVQTWIKSIL